MKRGAWALALCRRVLTRCGLAMGVLASVSACVIPGDRDLELAAAINGGDVEEVRRLLARGADPDARLAEGWRPLNLAASLGEVEVARALLEAGADPDVRQGVWSGREDGTPLMLGLAHPGIVALLLEADVDLEARDYQGRTVLMLAAARGGTTLVVRLVEAGATVAAVDETGGTVLHYAAGYPPGGERDENLEIVRLLIEGGADLQATNDCRRTAVYWAALRGFLGTVELLLSHGVEVDVACGDGTTALFVAATEGHAPVVRRLLAAGASPDVRRSDGQSALALAERLGHGAVAALLREHGAATE